MTEQEPNNNILTIVLQSILLGMKIGQNMIPNMNMISIFYNATSKPEVTLKQKSGVTVKQESEKEFIEIDLDKMDMGALYLVKYQDENYAVKKIDDDQVVFYDVIE